MSITYKNIIQSKFIETTETIQYSVAPTLKCVIDKVTLTNPTVNKATVTFYLVPSGGFFGTYNIVVKAMDIYPSQTKVVTELSGHTLESGGSIVAVCSLGSTVNIRASGREIA